MAAEIYIRRLLSMERKTLSIVDEQNREIASEEPEYIKIPVTELLLALWLRRWLLVAFALCGMVLSIGTVLLLPNQYTSTAQLMPPDQQAFASQSTLSSLSGAAALIPSGGGLLNARTPGATTIGLLGSRTVLDNIVKQFHLKDVYRVKLDSGARQELLAHSAFEEDKKSGLILISVTNKDRYLARDLVRAYVEDLNSILNVVNSSSARREREFLEDRLKTLKAGLDASTDQLSKFSSRNATLNPQTQGQSLIEAASRLQAELITAQAELYGLKAQYSDDNVRVRSVQARITELQSQLQKMTGSGKLSTDIDLKSDQIYPSIRELPLLGATYADLARQTAMQESIYEALSKQYELAKVQEAKELPTIKVLDDADIPETKSGPHRSLIVLMTTLVFLLVGMAWIMGHKLWELMDDSNALKRIPHNLMRGIQDSKAVNPS